MRFVWKKDGFLCYGKKYHKLWAVMCFRSSYFCWFSLSDAAFICIYVKLPYLAIPHMQCLQNSQSEVPSVQERKTNSDLLKMKWTSFS